MTSAKLTIYQHTRDSAGYTYVYPVVSRRAQGVSIGINLNPNNACNWACIYCQVPGLVRGNAPAIDLGLLESELRGFLTQVTEGDWLQHNVPKDMQQLQDIAFSGNGEPTSAAEFPQAITLVGQILQEMHLTQLKIRLITNGSLMQRSTVQDAVAGMAARNGEVWFKVDRATVEGMAKVNQVNDNPNAVKRRLLACAERCPTWIQTCWFALDGVAPDETELAAYVDFVQQVREHIAGVHLYGLARQPMQPGAERLSPVPEAVLQACAERVRQLGVVVNVSV